MAGPIFKNSCNDGAPGAPGGFTYTHTDDQGNSAPPLDATVADEVGLAWNVSVEADVDGYYIYRVVDGGTPSLIATIVDPATTTYTDDVSSLTSGDMINYEISAYDSCGFESGTSTLTDLGYLTCSSTPMNTPSAVNAPLDSIYNYVDDDGRGPAGLGGDGTDQVDLAAGFVTLSWWDWLQCGIDSIGYNIYESVDGGPMTQIENAYDPLSPGCGWQADYVLDRTDDIAYPPGITTFTYEIMFVNYCGVEGSSPSIGTVTKGVCTSAPAAPATVWFNNVPDTEADANQDVLLEWDPVAEATQYRVRQWNNFDFGWVDVGFTTDTSMTINVAPPAYPPGTQYRYMVYSWNSCDVESATFTLSPFINSRTCDIVPPINNLTLTNANPEDVDGGGLINLQWTYTPPPATDSNDLYVEISNDGGSTWNAPVFEVSLTPASLECGGGPVVCNYPYDTGADIDGTWYRFFVQPMKSGSGNCYSNTTDNVVKGSCDLGLAAPNSLIYTHTDMQGNDSPPLDYANGGDEVSLSWSHTTPELVEFYNIYEVRVSGGVPTQVLIDTVSSDVTSYVYNNGWMTGTDGNYYEIEAVSYCGITATAQTASMLYLWTCSGNGNMPNDQGYQHTDVFLNSPPLDLSATDTVELGFNTVTTCPSPNLDSYNVYESIDGGPMNLLQGGYVGTPGCFGPLETLIYDRSDDGTYPDGTTFSYEITSLNKCNLESNPITYDTITKGSCSANPSEPATAWFNNTPSTETDASGNVYLEWDSVTEAAGYEIRQYDSSDGYVLPWGIGNTTDTSMTINIFDNPGGGGPDYRYEVWSVTGCGMWSLVGTWSPVISAPACVPARITDLVSLELSPSEVIDGTLNIQWTLPEPSDTDVYIQKSFDYGDTWTAYGLISSVTDPTNTDAIDVSGDGAWTQYQLYVTSNPGTCNSNTIGPIVNGSCADAVGIPTMWFDGCLSTRRISLPVALNCDLRMLEVWEDEDWDAIGDTIIGYVDIPGGSACGGVDYTFTVPTPNVNGDCGMYGAKVVDFCGNESVVSNFP